MPRYAKYGTRRKPYDYTNLWVVLILTRLDACSSKTSCKLATVSSGPPFAAGSCVVEGTALSRSPVPAPTKASSIRRGSKCLTKGCTEDPLWRKTTAYPCFSSCSQLAAPLVPRLKLSTNLDWEMKIKNWSRIFKNASAPFRRKH